MSEAVPVLEMKAISKRFPGVQALSAVDFRLFAGEVHSVMGQNGAGKSTLIKVLTGVHPADSGRILLEGNEIKPSSPLDAQKLGISTVYQEVNLCPNLSVAENICLGRDGAETFGIRWGSMRRKAEALLADLNVRVDVTAPLSSYSLAVQQMCAIARSLSARSRILILDEPTSSLAEDEVKMLFSVVRRLKAQGMAILFITHFIDQTFEISDRITVLRNGLLVGEYPVSDLSRMGLITRMLGREVQERGPVRTKDGGLRASAAGGGRGAGGRCGGCIWRLGGASPWASADFSDRAALRPHACSLASTGRRREPSSSRARSRRSPRRSRPSSAASASAPRTASCKASSASSRCARTSSSPSRPSAASSATCPGSARRRSPPPTSPPWASRRAP